MRSSLRPAGLLMTAFALAVAACGGSPEEESSNDQGAVVQTGAPKLCAAVRGNGESILTHFASLSRVVEHYGVVDGIAGGSSGSITTFAYESMLENPVAHRCGSAACSPDADAARVALLLKSMQGYAYAVGDSEEGASVKGLVAVAGKVKADYEKSGVAGLAPTDFAEAATRLRTLLSVPELKEIVNPEIFTMLGDTAHLAFNVAEIKTSIEQLGAFKVDDNRLFFRTGLLNWPALATYFGRVGDFYAGNGPTDSAGMSKWLDACADVTRGKPWVEAAEVAVSGGTCGSIFSGLVSTYRKKARPLEGKFASRIDDRVTEPKSPLHKLVSTAVLERGAVTAYKASRARYVTGEFPTGNVPFAPVFDDVRFGYWGSDEDIAAARTYKRHGDDLKTTKFSTLGNAKWRTVLAASPAEPGLSRFVELPDGRISAGGWSDLAPALVLQNLGCEQVVYITREGEESAFATKIAKFAGMSEQHWKDLYDLNNPKSSYSLSIASADAVWCTTWDAFPTSKMGEMVLDAWKSPLETHGSFSVTPLRPYAGATARADRLGCTPGKQGKAVYPR